MTTDYLVSSLPALAFGAPAPVSWEWFREFVGDDGCRLPSEWVDLEVQLRNAVAEARGGARFKRQAEGCSLYWRDRVAACFQEKDVAKRDELLDKVWWDAAGELTSPSSPLGRGALATYAVRLKVAIRRDGISREKGNEAFNRLTAETKR